MKNTKTKTEKKEITIKENYNAEKEISWSLAQIKAQTIK